MTRLLPEACAHTGGDPLGTPLMVTSIIRVHSVVLRAGTGAPGPGPELGKIASMLPNSAEARIRVRATKARLPPASIRSISCLIAWPPASAIRPGDLFQPVFAACIRNHLRAFGGAAPGARVLHAGEAHHATPAPWHRDFQPLNPVTMRQGLRREWRRCCADALAAGFHALLIAAHARDMHHAG